MNLSAEKRKMSRMRVDLSARIFWGCVQNQSDVSIQNLSIHGISFCSKKYFIKGSRFHLTLPGQMKESGKQKISAEVVRCERSNGLSSDGKFRVGAKFLFPSIKTMESKDNSTHEILSPLPIIDSPIQISNRYQGRLTNYPEQVPVRGQLGTSAFRAGMTEVNVELVQAVRTPAVEETVYTRIQIKQAWFAHSLSSSVLNASGESLPETENNLRLANLARPKSSSRRLL